MDRPALDASGHARSLVHGPRQSYLLDPALDLLINLANLTAVVGGGMAAVIAVGYALADRGVDVWGPPVLIMLALLAANALLRGLRARRRRVSSRRNGGEERQPRMPERATRDSGSARLDAENDFDRARRRHTLSAVCILRRRRVTAPAPLSLDEVLTPLGRRGERSLGVQCIRLPSIVGTVDKCRDFDRGFRPTTNRIRQRWILLALAQRHGEPMPPIEVFRVGDRHFVHDGHHHVSLAKVNGNEMIDADVTEVLTTLP